MRSRGAPVSYSTESPENIPPYFLSSHFSSVPLSRRLPFFRRTHVSAFNFCMSLFR